LITAKSVNALAWAAADYFMASARDERFDQPWPIIFSQTEMSGLSRRVQSVEEACLLRIRERMSRVAKLAVRIRPGPTPKARGLFLYFTGFDSLYATRQAQVGGQRRMADDPQAPSRSYLKVEEAYAILEREPASGESVVDLGAAPGGWSYSAAKRGALVTAVDNGPMKSGGLHPGISHQAVDAFKFEPSRSVDWLFCDMVEDPQRVIALIDRWMSKQWCRRVVVNFKYGRIDPISLLRDIAVLRKYCSTFRVRHLFHDREELTLVGELKAGEA
jgi:23S rRNA (cytidine2498-2'-O)-methyltransferase